MKQDTNYWSTQESINRYAKMQLELNDVESSYLFSATQKINKKVAEIKILDLGCGGGRTTIPLHNAGYDIYGIDISPVLIENLKSKHPSVKAEIGDAKNLRFEDNFFDIILFSHNSLDCLYPIEARNEALKEISRVLKPNGYFIFSSHVFNLIPYDISTAKNIINNKHRLKDILTNQEGFYSETMGSGEKVELYSSSKKNIEINLGLNNMHLLKATRVINYHSNLFSTFIRSFLNWERYYLAVKNNPNENRN